MTYDDGVQQYGAQILKEDCIVQPVGSLQYASETSQNIAKCRLKTVMYMRTILMCAQKRTSSQLSLPHGTVN